MNIENCPFCILHGVESECEVAENIDEAGYEGYKPSYWIKCDNYCNYQSRQAETEVEAISTHNRVSLAVRESMWTRFVEGDESTYPKEHKMYSCTIDYGTLEYCEIKWCPKYGIHGEWASDNKHVKAWRELPTPFKEES